MEGNGTISNTKEYSGKNILEKIGLLWDIKNENNVKKRRAVDGA